MRLLRASDPADLEALRTASGSREAAGILCAVRAVWRAVCVLLLDRSRAMSCYEYRVDAIPGIPAPSSHRVRARTHADMCAVSYNTRSFSTLIRLQPYQRATWYRNAYSEVYRLSYARQESHKQVSAVARQSLRGRLTLDTQAEATRPCRVHTACSMPMSWVPSSTHPETKNATRESQNRIRINSKPKRVCLSDGMVVSCICAFYTTSSPEPTAMCRA